MGELKKFFPNGLKTIKRRIDSGKGLLLLTDYDGTLVRFTDDPGETLTPLDIADILVELERKGVKVAVISGRSLDGLRRLIDMKGIIKAGLHGMVIDDGGELTYTSDICYDLKPKIRHLKEVLSEKLVAYDGAFIEDKGLALAVHYRKFTGDKERLKDVFYEVCEGAIKNDLEFIEGDMVLEIRPKGVDKGDAVGHLRGKYGNNRVTVYFGDDVTDEDAFRELKDDKDAFTVKVKKEDEKVIESDAEYSVEGVEGVKEAIGELVSSL